MAERGVTFDIALAQDFGLPEMAIRVEEFFKGNISDNILSKLVERKVYFVDQLLDDNKSLKSWQQFRIAKKDPVLSPLWFNDLQDLFNMPGYTKCYLQDWIEEKLDLIENVESDRRAESEESYMSEVDGVTEDEGEIEFVPRALPVESPEERAERKSLYIHSIL
jgi:hypothetical protein